MNFVGNVGKDEEIDDNDAVCGSVSPSQPSHRSHFTHNFTNVTIYLTTTINITIDVTFNSNYTRNNDNDINTDYQAVTKLVIIYSITIYIDYQVLNSFNYEYSCYSYISSLGAHLYNETIR